MWLLRAGSAAGGGPELSHLTIFCLPLYTVLHYYLFFNAFEEKRINCELLRYRLYFSFITKPLIF